MVRRKKQSKFQRQINRRLTRFTFIGSGLILALMLVFLQQIFSEEQDANDSIAAVNSQTNQQQQVESQSVFDENQPHLAEKANSLHQEAGASEFSKDTALAGESLKQNETTTNELPNAENDHRVVTPKPIIIENINKKKVLPNIKVESIYNTLFHSLEGEFSLYYQALDDSTSKPLVLNDQKIRSASVIKLFVLASLFDQVEKGLINLTDTYVLKAEDKVGGTGDLQNMAEGSEFTIQELAEKMIIISDNSATNILIERLGGVTDVQTLITQLGYPNCQLNRLMVDMEALANGQDNYVEAKEVGDLLAKIYRRQLISKTASEQMLAILKQQSDRRMLAQNLTSDTIYYGKTGNFEEYGVQNDAAIIETKKGAFVLVCLSQNGQKDQQLNALNQLGGKVTTQFVEYK